MEVFYMLFKRGPTKNRKRSLKQLIKYFCYRSKIQLDHRVWYVLTLMENSDSESASYTPAVERLGLKSCDGDAIKLSPATDTLGEALLADAGDICSWDTWDAWVTSSRSADSSPNWAVASKSESSFAWIHWISWVSCIAWVPGSISWASWIWKSSQGIAPSSTTRSVERSEMISSYSLICN